MDYWRDVARAKGITIEEALKMYGESIPQPLAENEEAWSAFRLVSHCMHYGFNGPTAPNWTDARTVLELHGMWSPDVQEKLSVCFDERFRIIRAEQDRRASMKPKR